jgi:membrane protein DedA with SNARE-associated domain
MDALQPFLAFLGRHVYVAAFVANAIDATGIPFPGRIVLILAGTFVTTDIELALTIVAGALGALIGDHVLYAVGWRGGASLLAMYCRATLGSERCIEDTVSYFRRFGPSAIMLGRYSTGVRLFAAILSGCGHIRYTQFLRYDVAGSFVYATLWVVLGHLFGDQVLGALAWLGRRRVLLAIIPAAGVAILAYRVWRRRKYGAARPVTITTCSSSDVAT